MKKITDFKTLESSNLNNKENFIIKCYLNELFQLYDIDTIKDIGSIYFIEQSYEINSFNDFEMYEPISENNIEFVDKIFLSQNTQEPDFVLACFIISNDYAVYLFFDKNILSPEQYKILCNASFISNKYFNWEF